MNRIQKARALVVDIQQFLMAGIVPDLLSEKALAANYTEICQKTYDRLNQCIALLDDGQYSDAIRLAEESPSLLDLIDVLTFPMLDKWLSHVKAHDLSVPRTLDATLANRINEAYSKVENAAAVERSLRRAAMLRPPDLYGCILALRRLSSTQPDVTFWKEDLLVFEKRRLDQIAAEFQDAMRAKDLQQSSALLSELSAKWQATEEASRLTEVVRHGVITLQEEVAVRQAERIVDSMHDARTANDFSAVGVYLEQYRHLQSTGYLKPTANMVQNVSSIEIWYVEESAIRNRSDEMRQAIEQLQVYINEPEVRNLKEMLRLRSRVYGANLDELYNVALPIDMTVSKVDSMIAFLEKRASIRIMIAVGATVSLAALLIVVGFFAYRQRSVNQQAIYFQQAFDAANDARDLEQFYKLKTELEKTTLAKHLKSHPEVQASMQKEDDLTVLVQTAQRGFSSRLETLGRIAESGYSTDAEFLRIFAEADKLRILYPVLRDDSKNEEALSKHKLSRQAFWESRLLESEQQLQTLASRLQAVVDTFGDPAIASYSDRDKTCDEIKNIIESASRIKAAIPEILAKNVSSPSLQTSRARFDDVEKKSVSLLNRVHLCKQRRADIEGSHSMDNYYATIAAYTNDFPNDPVSIKIQGIMPNRIQYEQFVAWSGFVIDKDNMEELFKKVAGIPKENPYWYPVLTQCVDPIKRTATVWEEVTQDAYKGQQSWRTQQQLQELYQINFRSSDAKMTAVSGVAQGNKREAGKAGDQTFYEVDVYIPREEDKFATYKTGRIRSDRIISMELMPHCVYIQQLIQKIKVVPSDKVQEFLLRTILELRDTDKIQSDLFRIRILSYFAGKAVDIAGKGEVPALDKIVDSATSLDPKLEWICSCNKDVLKANADAKRILSNLLVGVDLLSDVQRKPLIYKTCMARGARWMGFASPIDGRPVLAQPTTGEIWILRPDATGVLVPVIASEDGKQFGVRLQPGESLFGPFLPDSPSTRSLRQALGRKLNKAINDVELPIVWPRSQDQIVNGSSTP